MSFFLSSLRNDKIAHPEPGSIEVILFGSGYGESVLVHLPDGSWIVVDSCYYNGESEPAALTYLRYLEVNLERDVKSIVATHWDDDHIKGLSKIVTECAGAKFCLSAALKDSKFFNLLTDPVIEMQIRNSSSVRTGLTEMRLIHEQLFERKQQAIYLFQDRTFLTNKDIQVASLSPSDKIFEKSIEAIIAQVPDNKNGAFKIKAPRPNHTSVVIYISAGRSRVLLGADLEECSEHKGWSIILDESEIVQNEMSSGSKTAIFKVAHHGSQNGHHPDLKKKLLSDNAISIVAPWQLGGGNLPTDEDKLRIKGYSHRAFVSNDRENLARIKNVDQHTLKKLRERGARPVNYKSGFIKVKLDTNNGDPEVFCFGGAYEI